MDAPQVKHISECFIKPKHAVEASKQPYHLAPWDLAFLSFHYIQKGLLFRKPSQYNDKDYSTGQFLDSLKDSLSLALVHFYPLAGQLATRTDEARHESLVYIDCNKGPGAKFIHAVSDKTVSDILISDSVPKVVHSFFDHDRAVGYDGHTRPLLSVQVTELIDGVFIGCSINHAVVDGTSYWMFWNVWSEIHRANRKQLPDAYGLPVNNRWFPEGYGPEISLPFSHPDEFVCRYESPPQLQEKFFHFTSQAIATLKSKAGEESGNRKISSFQALTALVWRSIIRATHRPHEDLTRCRLPTNNRLRLNPNLPENYFGNCINPIEASVTVGELLGHNLGWVASNLHQLVVNYKDRDVRDRLKEWLRSPLVRHLPLLGTPIVTFASSPRFDMYGNEFGLGKAIALRSGYANKFIGLVHTYPGCEGNGSVDVEICLPPDSMKALESDEEFMAAALI